MGCAGGGSDARAYREAVAALEAGVPGVDAAGLRLLASRLPDHDPFLHERPAYREFRDALSRVGGGGPDEVRRACAALLDLSWINVEAHAACAQAYQRAGDGEAASRHARIARGLVDSITRDADGTSFDSAYHVVSVLEQQAVLRSRGLRLVARRLDVDRQMPFDILTVEDQTGQRQEVYFQIRSIMVSRYRAHVPARGFAFNQMARGGPAALAALLLMAALAGWITYQRPGAVAALYRRAESALCSRRWLRVAAALAACVLFFALRNEFLNLDAMTFTPRFTRDVPALGAHVTHDQMWEFYIHSRLWAMAHATLGWSVKLTYQVLSSAAGGLFVLLLMAFARRVAPGRPLAFVLLAASGGFMQLFFGDVENYTLTAVIILAYLLSAARFLQERGTRLWRPAALLGLAITFHLLAGFLLPSLAWLVWVAWRREGWRPLAPAAAAFLAVTGATLAFFHVQGLPLGAMVHSSHLMGYGRGIGTMLARPSAAYYWDHLNLITLLAPCVILLPVLLALGRIRRDALGVHLLLAAAGMILFQLAWQAKLGVYYDWNLYANVALVLSLWIGAGAAAGPLSRAGRAALVALCILFAGQSAQWIAGNHNARTPYTQEALET